MIFPNFRVYPLIYISKVDMITIKVTCPICGDQELKPSDIVLTVCSVDTLVSYFSWYTFTCTKKCKEKVRRPACPETVQALRDGGVPEEKFPAEFAEHTRLLDLRQDSGDSPLPPINHDDILVFHQRLQTFVLELPTGVRR